MQNLEFARDLQNQFRNFVTEEDRINKKKAKKEAADRAKAETARLANILSFQKMLAALTTNAAKVKWRYYSSIKLTHSSVVIVCQG